MNFVNNLKYDRIKAEGNKPLLLSYGKLWFVQEGKVDIFITKVFGTEAIDARSYLFSIEKGELFLGVEKQAVEEGVFALLAVGNTETELLEIDLTQLTTIRTDKEKREATDLLKAWIEKWNLEGIKTDYQFDWDLGLPLEQLANFNKAVFAQAIAIMLQSKKQEVLRHKLKAEKDELHMSSGLRKLMNTLSSKAKDSLEEEEFLIDNLLFKACLAVGKAKKIKIVPSLGLKQGKADESKDLLGDIARASQIRIRQIILKGTWWKEDNGALLAYKENGDPVALLPLSPKKYILYDPSNESRVVVDSNIASTLKPQAYTFYRPLPAKVITYKDLLKYLIDGIWKSDAVTVLVMGILGGLLGVLTPSVTGKIFDQVIPDGEKTLLVQIGFLLMAIAVTTFALNLTRAFAMHRIEGRTEADLQAAVWDRLLSLPVPFFKDYTAGELASRAMGLSEIRVILSGAVVNTLISGIFSIFYFILLFYYSWKLALICTLIIAVVVAISLLFGKIQIRYERELLDINNYISGKVFGLLSGVSKIKTSGAEKRAFNNWAQDFSKARSVTYKKERIGNRMAVFNSTVNMVATGIIFFTMLKLKGINLPAGKFIAFNSAFSSFLGAMLEISNVVLQLNVVKPLYERVKPILETLPEYDTEKADPGELEGNIEVKHLYFRYNEDGPWIINDVSFEIKKGDYVGIVGPSGSGKSTLFRLLLGFEKPDAGQIYYDQQDLNNLDIRAVRRQLGVVLQNGQLMTGSIFDNIVAAHPRLTINDAWEAARMAGMEQDIKDMPMGMHTMISEYGSTLSGGQRQRLLIARAIISKPKILFFDEATSALDNKTQKIVTESLNSLGVTRIVIAHRLSTIANCNKIIVMDRGRIVEQGSYEELYKKGGLFTKLVQRQLA
ncbi:MAG TPA: NHLP bacteriocin export ABC transporter permease/ATPase subunit [Clostridia bacterium]|nr:NHLP bacteriocin export ABC transporter permease/ATPase subunit [Clostridia bacterium]